MMFWAGLLVVFGCKSTSLQQNNSEDNSKNNAVILLKVHTGEKFLYGDGLLMSFRATKPSELNFHKTIKVSEPKKLLVMTVPAGTYDWNTITKISRKKFSDKKLNFSETRNRSAEFQVDKYTDNSLLHFKPFTVEAGKVNYIGDYYFEQLQGLSFSFTVKNQFAQTSQEFKKQTVEYTDLPMVQVKVGYGYK